MFTQRYKKKHLKDEGEINETVISASPYFYYSKITTLKSTPQPLVEAPKAWTTVSIKINENWSHECFIK